MSKILGRKIDYSDRTEYYINLIQTKGNIEKHLSPGKFLAHGAYADELEQILNASGLMSSAGRINKKLISREETPRWKENGMPDHPDAAAVFFYPWESRKNPAGIYSSTQNDPRGTTDLSIIFPTESIIQHAKAIQVRGEEIAVTGSQDSLEAGELINTGDDEMVIPLQEAYLIIPTESRDLITQLLKKYNFSDAWINQHTRTIDFNRGSHPAYNYTVLAENRESITK